MKKKTLGLIGGIGPESTVDYYKMIIKKFRQKSGSDEYPSFLINNINMTEMLGYVKNNQREELTDFLAGEVKALIKGGADFAALASNTPHLVIDELQKSVEIPMVSIVEETMKFIAEKKLEKVGLFGTMSTMNAGFYQRVGEKYSVEVIIPSQADKDYINDKYFSELVVGIIREETKKRLIEIINKMQSEAGISGLILGGTELPLILRQEDFKNFELLNTSEIHVDALIKIMLGI